MMRGIFGIIGRLFVLLLISILRIMQGYNATGYSINYLDVGQGDSILANFDNQDILIDVGGVSYVNHKLDKYKNADTTIEYLVLTHPHDDHYLGLFEILKRYEVENVVINPICGDYGLYDDLLDMLSFSKFIYSRYISFSYSRGRLLYENKIEANPGAGDGACSEYGGNLNNASVITQINVFGKVFLFMGDAETEAESELVDLGVIPSEVYVLKAGHHCSDTSTSERFLEYVSLKYAVCSYGKDNKYGHPSTNLINEFKRRNIDILSTEKMGDIIINLSQ